MSIEPTYTERGLAQWPAITDRDGDRVRVGESSLASSPHLWLSIEARGALLSLDQARQLRDTLDAAISHHYQA